MKSQDIEELPEQQPEQQQAQPSQPRNYTKLYNIMIIVCVVLIAIGWAFTHFTTSVLSDRGWFYITKTQGNSMHPTLDNDALIIYAKKEVAPFSDLEVGDIIFFHQRVGYNNYVDSKMHYVRKEGEEPTPEPTPFYQDGDFDYNIDVIIHRIVEIDDEHGDRAVFTRGDNNDRNDTLYILESGYMGKVIWYAKGLGPYFSIMQGIAVIVPFFAFIGLIVFVVMRIDVWWTGRKETRHERSNG